MHENTAEGMCIAAGQKPRILLSVHRWLRFLSCVQGVANRDVKLENTLLVSSARPLIKLCDFGYSKVQSPFPCIYLAFYRLMGCIPVMCAASPCFQGFLAREC